MTSYVVVPDKDLTASLVAQAVSASAIAAASANMFVDTTAGLAGTAEGSYFSTPGDGVTSLAILYRKVSGAAVSIGTFGSGALLSSSDIDERARDAVGTALTVSNPLTKTVNDGSNTITIALASGTSFPGSPATNDRFYRTDLHVQFFYDGTRWLSDGPALSCAIAAEDVLNGFGGTGATHRAVNPRYNEFDIYIEKFSFGSVLLGATTSTNYFTARLQTRNAAGAAVDLGASALSTQNDAQAQFFARSANINSVVTKATAWLQTNYTMSGTQTILASTSFTYRLVGA